MNSVQKETIKLYARQLKVPTFNNYKKIIRQLSPTDGYEQFLIASASSAVRFTAV